METAAAADSQCVGDDGAKVGGIPLSDEGRVSGGPRTQQPGWVTPKPA